MIQKYLPPNRLLQHQQYASMCDFSFMRHDQTGPGFIQPNNIEEIKSGSTVYLWVDRVNELFSFLIRNNIQDITLITGDNDYTVNPNGSVVGWPQNARYGMYACPKNVTRWFAHNGEVENDLMKPFPVGVTKWSWKSDHPGKLFPTDIETYRSFMRDIPRKKLVYYSCSHSVNPFQRKMISDIVTNNCPNASIPGNFQPQETYWTNLQEHKFVVCPPGNGKDCNKVWESLYFGAVPIVEDSMMNRSFAKIFPILLVNTWFDITPKFLEEKYEEMMSKTWRYDLLDAENYFDYHGIRRKKVQR